MKEAPNPQFQIDNDQTRLCQLAQNWSDSGEFKISSADIDEVDSGGMTALHFAAFHGLERAANNLIRAGAIVNISRSDGATPLHLATHNGHTHIVQLLLDAGADVNLTTKHGVTPLHLAASKNHPPIVKILLARPDIKVNELLDSGETPLKLALNGRRIVLQSKNLEEIRSYEAIINLIWNKNYDNKAVEVRASETGIDEIRVSEKTPTTAPAVTESAPVTGRPRSSCCTIS